MIFQVNLPPLATLYIQDVRPMLGIPRRSLDEDGLPRWVTRRRTKHDISNPTPQQFINKLFNLNPCNLWFHLFYETNPKLERSDNPELASGYKTNPIPPARRTLTAICCFTKRTQIQGHTHPLSM